MPKENQSDGRAHDCDHEQIFCAQGHIHAHRKSREIGVLMAMCTSKPIIGKRAPGGWLRLMRFDNRLIIDFFQKAVCILKWLFLIKKQIQKEKCESPSWKIRYWKCFDQFIVERAAIILDLHLSSESWKTSTRKHLMTQNKENTRYFAKSWVLCDKLVQLITILWTNRVKPINCNYFLLPIDFD